MHANPRSLRGSRSFHEDMATGSMILSAGIKPSLARPGPPSVSTTQHTPPHSVSTRVLRMAPMCASRRDLLVRLTVIDPAAVLRHGHTRCTPAGGQHVQQRMCLQCHQQNGTVALVRSLLCLQHGCWHARLRARNSCVQAQTVC